MKYNTGCDVVGVGLEYCRVAILYVHKAQKGKRLQSKELNKVMF